MRTKYHNKKTTVDGITFDSRMEARRYSQLMELKKYGKIRDLDIQPRWTWTVTQTANGKSVSRKKTYIADFAYTDCETEQRIVEDVKGVLTAEYKRKKAVMKSLFGIQIKEVRT